VAFRPITAPTEEQAWQKAHDRIGRISMRGYDLLADSIEVGQQVIPVVREEAARRDAAAAALAPA
jgi:hypothetical protein